MKRIIFLGTPLLIILIFILYSKIYPLYKGLKPGYLPSKIKIISDEELKYLKLPENFAIQIFAKSVNGARVIKEDPAGNLIVSLTKEGKIVSLPDLNQDGRADKVIILLEGLQNPHGMEIKCLDVRHPKNCKLYVAETEKLVQYDLVFDEKEKIYKPVNPEKILDLPKGWPEKYWYNLLVA